MKTSSSLTRFIGLYFLIGIVTAAFANPIDQNQSVQAARRWMEISKNPMGRAVGKIGKTQTYFNAAGEPRFRVVNLEPSGFMVLAVDDALEPVLAFSHEGKFEGQPGNPLFDLLSRDTEERTLRSRGESGAHRRGHPTQTKWSNLTTPPLSMSAATSSTGAAASTSSVSDVCVAPMLQSQWNQNTISSGTTQIAVYNYYTPPFADGDSSNYVCGCVATAWAQIMRFYQWPTAGVGHTAYSISVNGVTQQRALRGGDGNGGPYDWANMVLVPGAGITTQQRQAIGALTADAGVANNMAYAPGGSSAYLSSDKARSVFGYASAVNSLADLPSLLVAIRTNLDAGMPVALSIWGSPGGHEIVCDGYGYNLSTLYHHLNMGWGGASNLWYNLPTIGSYTIVNGCTYNIDPTGQGEIISGRVTRLDGTPLAGITINLTGSAIRSTTTNSNGVYACKGVGNTSTWTVLPQSGSYVFGPIRSVVTTGSSADYALIGDRLADFQAGTSSQTGYLQVNLAPLNAANAGAQWQVDDGAWHNSGELVTSLLSGSHTVAFKTVTGWIAPAKMQVSVNINQLTTCLGTYVAAPTVSNFAGKAGLQGVTDSTGSNARFNYPRGVAMDGSGNVYVADQYNYTIRKITSGGVVSTLAGSAGFSGTADGIGSAARFNEPVGVALDGSGNVYVADASNHTIRKITPGGSVTTLAGKPTVSGTADGTGTAAQFYHPSGVAVDGSGNVYVADQYNHTIRKITSVGNVTTLAGTAGSNGSADGTGVAALFFGPAGVALDGSGNVYVADQWNDAIRAITSAGVVTTLAGSSGNTGSADGLGNAAQFNGPAGVTVDVSGNVYVADQYNYTIRKITPDRNVFTLAGSPGVAGSADGNGNVALFSGPFGIAVDGSGNLYVGDYYNYTIRKITPAAITTPTVTTGAANFATTSSVTLTGTVNPNGVSTTAQFEYGLTNAYGFTAIVTVSPSAGATAQNVSALLSGLQPGVIYHYRLDATNANGMAEGSDATFSTEGVPIVTTGAAISGTSTSATLAGTVNPNGFMSTAQFRYGLTTLYGGTATVLLSPSNGLTAQSLNATLTGLQPGANYHYCMAATNYNGTAFGSDATFTTPVQVSTFAGSPGVSGTTDATGSAALFNGPFGITVDGSGNFYVVDTENFAVRKITASGGVTTFAGHAGVPGSANGTGSAILFGYPTGIATDGSGNVYVADYASIRKITTAGVSNTFAGDLRSSGSVDGSAATARFSFPEGLAVDGSNNVYVADTYNHTIRKITSAGIVSTLAGSPGVLGNTDATGSNAQFNYPSGVAVDANGNVYVADQYNQTIRKITSAGAVSTLAGTPGATGTSDGTGSAAQFYLPVGIAMGENGNLYVADQYNQTIRKITPAGVVSTLAGTIRSAGSADGVGRVAQFNGPAGITMDTTGNLYVTDQNNHTIRKIAQYANPLPTVALLGNDPLTFEASASYSDPGATALDAKGNTLTPSITASTVVPNLPGTYNVRWTATDGLGLTGTALRTVNVVDTTPPAITAPASLTVNATSISGANVAFSTTALDVVSGTVATLNSPASGSFFPLGATTVLTTASDGAGNVAFRPFVVTVIIPTLGAQESVAPQFSVSGTTVNVTVKSSVPTRNYQLQYSTDLTSGTWLNLGSVQIGTGSDLLISNTRNPAVPRCFYRLKLN